jgi:ABC-type glycerol-3-phosphate transport system permease component
MVLTAIRPATELMQVPPAWIPGGISLSNFVDVWSTIPLAQYVLNTLIVAVITTLVGVTVATLAAYGLVRYRFGGRTVILVIILFTLTIPTVVTLVPFYTLLYQFGLLNTRIGLALSYVVWAVPFMTLLLRSYFQTSYSIEVEEAALTDGCSRVSVLWRIMLPLSLPGLFSASVFTVLLAWNEFIWASVIMTDDSVRPASIGLQLFVSQLASTALLGQWMAAAVTLTIPLALLFIAVQRYLTASYGGVLEK